MDAKGLPHHSLLLQKLRWYFLESTAILYPCVGLNATGRDRAYGRPWTRTCQPPRNTCPKGPRVRPPSRSHIGTFGHRSLLWRGLDPGALGFELQFGPIAVCESAVVCRFRRHVFFVAARLSIAETIIPVNVLFFATSICLSWQRSGAISVQEFMVFMRRLEVLSGGRQGHDLAYILDVLLFQGYTLENVGQNTKRQTGSRYSFDADKTQGPLRVIRGLIMRVQAAVSQMGCRRCRNIPH